MSKSDATKPSRKVFYVYTIVDPRKEKIFYVGKGMEKRPFAHAAEARTDCDCKKCKYVRDVWAAGYSVRVDYVYETTDERDAPLHEKQLIVNIGLRRLCNKRPGCISVQVKGWNDPVAEAEHREFMYRIDQDRLTEMRRRLEAGELNPKSAAYWKKKIDANKPLVSKPPPWMKEVIEKLCFDTETKDCTSDNTF